MSYISRNLEAVVKQVTSEYPVVLVTGPRQVGKTTMLQKMMEGTERGYVSLDDLYERSRDRKGASHSALAAFHTFGCDFYGL